MIRTDIRHLSDCLIYSNRMTHIFLLSSHQYFSVISILVNFKVIEVIIVWVRWSSWLSFWKYQNLNKWRLKWQSELPRLNLSDWQSYSLLAVEWKICNYLFIIWCRLNDSFNNNNKTFTFIDHKWREWTDYIVVLFGY